MKIKPEQSLRSKNAQLQKELVAKNRELEIEASLERVRVKAMAMQRSGELADLVTTLFNELTKLDFALTRCAIVIADADDSLGWTIWMANSEPGQLPFSFYRKSFNHPYPNAAYREWKKRTPKWVYHLKGTEKKAMDDYYDNSEEVVHMPNAIRQAMARVGSIILSHSFNNFGYLRADSMTPLSEDNLNILYRFAKVFDMCYTRFTDIKQAEAQAREAEIALGLERVRARTMAMQKSGELAETVSLLFKQLLGLGIRTEQIRTCGIVTFDDKKPLGEQWITETNGEIIPQSFIVPYDEAPAYKSIYKAWKHGEQFMVIHLEGKKLMEHLGYLAKGTHVPIRDVVLPQQATEIYNHVMFFSQGCLFIITKEALPEYHDVFKRFGTVFQQSYTRFLDLQKAETQVREAQIETALERVRSRTMGMQHSAELQEASLLLFQQAEALGVKAFACGFDIWDDDRRFATAWMGTVQGLEPPFKTDSSKDIYLPIYEAAQRGETLFVMELGGEELKAHYDYLAIIPLFRDVILKGWTKAGVSAPTYQIIHCAFFAQGYLMFISYEPCPAAYDIFKRFAKVFEQTYTRFLDLQKAEEQARESQIETALERVRSRTMGMQHSDELREVIQVIYEQFVHLGLDITSAGFTMDYKERDDWHIWAADSAHSFPSLLHVPYFDHPHWNRFNEAKRKGLDAFASTLTFEEKNSLFEQYSKYIPDLPKGAKEYIYSTPGYTISNIFLKNVALFIDRFSTVAFSDADNAILQRFGKVFEQTYTRFKDLEQAEEQAREAQIELGLERVRARAMAMQNSGEINDLIGAVFYELTKLDLVVTRCRLWIIDPASLSCMTWQANQETPAHPLGSFIKYNEQPFYLAILKAWKEGSLKLVYELKGSEKNSWDEFLFNETEFSRLPEVVKEGMRSEGRALLSASFGNFGAMQTGSPDPLSDKQMEILSRFVKVFDMSYTRFNDLKQAEAQARESQIQLALERVRARTSAMQKSDELAEVIQVVHDQLYQLDFNINNANFILDYNESDGMNCWAAVQGALYAIKIQIPYYDDTVNNYFNSVKAKGPGLYITTFSAEEKNRFFERIFACNPRMSTERTPLVFGGPGYAWSTVLMKNIALTVQNYSGTPYSDAENEIIKRFGTVFEQTYTRFNDLKQAEEQARESQIQLALERVRARTSAMQKSDELREAIKLIFEQLLQLNFNIDVANFALNCKESDDFNLWLAVHGQQYPTKIHIPYFDHPIFNIFVEAKEKGKDFYAFTCTFEEKNEFFDHFFKNSPKVDEERKEAVYSSPGYAQSTVLMKTISLAIINYAAIPYSEAENMMLKRFGKVFEQTYTRFLDLQRAEAQVREAQVQLALERVRARTMAMHQSIELAETSEVLFQQFAGLGIVPERVVIGIMIENPRKIDLWGTEQGGNKMGVRFELREDWTVGFDKVYNAWEDKKKNLTIVLKDKDLDHHVHYMRDVIGMPMQLELIHQQRVLYAAFFTKGFLMMVANEAEPKETLDILERFAGVFNLTYTRFLDLQKAEEQAREARIETSLERVRSKAMAMRSSEDLADAIGVFYHELGLLSVTPKRCGLGLIDKETRITEISTMNTTEQGDSVEVIGSISLTNHPVLVGIYDNWLLQKEYHPILRGNEIKAYYQLLRPQISYPDYPHDVVQYGYFFFFQDGGVFAWTDTALPEDELQIYRRFNSVLSLTYRRYKDIKDAEAQARESQIQLALERIRARTMAMQKSDELAETAMTLFQQFNELGVKPERIFIGNMDENARTIEFWGTDQGGNQMNPRFEVNADATIGFSQIYKAWKTKKKTHTVIMKGRELADHVRYVQDVLHMPMQPELVQQQRIMYSAFFSKGLLMIVTPEIQSNETIGVLERFAGVFDGTYTRFLDLQKAEGQAREAQIEVALEKVRGKAMAMHNSKDLSSAVSLVFTELKKLGIRPIRCGVGFMTKDPPRTLLYTAAISNDNDTLDLVGWVDVVGHPVLEKIYDSWLKQEDYFPVLNGKELKAYYKKLAHGLHFPFIPDGTSDEKQYGYFLPFPEGMLNAWAERPYSEPELKTLDRFRSIISLTFRRYLDLKKAEEAAREAIKRASLDRVRAEIASMRAIADLDRITPLIWNELTILGVPFIRCGVFIMDEAQEVIHTYLSTPDGKAIAAFQLHFSNDSGNGVNGAALRGWREKQMVTLHWTEEEFRNFSHSLKEQGEIISEESYLTERPPTGLDLHFFPFLQGMLYAGNSAPLSDDDKDLVQSLADAFSTAYARYEDFNRLELAKQEVERTLTDLKAAQTRLIQSEKMASLGELTAGIAHEIQNPLNFVNNFSEVNQDLLEELKAESLKPKAERDEQLEIELINDLINNEQKINHHGKRADGIVKGMLQHSRTGGGEKLPTNINSVAEEYMRLSYHGLRAKDKSFNAEMVTHFDAALPKIEAVGQDIGRVFLNLFNNAFYAVNQRSKKADAGYKPEVSVTTFAEDGLVVIKVKDNGIGMPEQVKDKIMQPFFTTKPTGEGTGLGLSLTYDMVVKGHGGKIEVNTKEGEFTEFIVSLPLNEN